MPSRYELQNLLSGTRTATERNLIKATTRYLRESTPAGRSFEEKQLIKEQESQALIAFAAANKLIYKGVNESRYLAEGAEQKVYLAEDGIDVIKVNGGIFYATWKEYFYSLLLHNYFFPATTYELIGFQYQDEELFAVVKQRYILSDTATDTNAVREFMLQNGFVNTKNEDYRNEELGIILEDLHDENVLTSSGILFFIDTVFYLTPDFIW